MRIPWDLEDLAEALGVDDPDSLDVQKGNFRNSFRIESDAPSDSGATEWIAFQNERDAEKAAIEDAEALFDEQPDLMLSPHFSHFLRVSPTDIRLISQDEGERAREDAEYSGEDDEDELDRIEDERAREVRKMLRDDLEGFLLEYGYMDHLGRLRELPSFVQFDTKRAAEYAVDVDGVAYFLAVYDGYEIDLPHGGVAYAID